MSVRSRFVSADVPALLGALDVIADALDDSQCACAAIPQGAIKARIPDGLTA